jgi:hypothetical protein
MSRVLTSNLEVVTIMSAADVVIRFMSALSERDYASARRLLADNVTFEGPFDMFREPDSYLEALRGLYPIVKSITRRRLFEDGDDVCLLYDMETSTPIGTAFICEWSKVDGEKIKAIRAVFDARPFAPMFARTA